MPWSNQGGGGWRGGGPWGTGPQPSGPTPPALEELLRRSQDKIRRALPGGSVGATGVMIVAAVLLAIWGLSGFYTVKQDELGVVLQFGRYYDQYGPGLHYHWPYPIQSVQIPQVLTRRTIDIGMRVTGDSRRPGG